MTTDNDSRPDDANEAAPEGAAAATPPQTGTGEGGEQSIVRGADQPSSGGRPQRAPHLDTQRRATLTEQAPPERAMVTRAQRRRAQAMEVTRRQILKVSFWGVFGFGLTGALSTFLSFFWPRGVQGFGGTIPVSSALVPQQGNDPVRVTTGKFWLVNLLPEEGTFKAFGHLGDGGLVALWWKCPHLGCTVPWRPTFTYEGVQGWFRCPCHGSTYTKAGVRVFGPAPRPMDTMLVTVNADGSLTVDTGNIRKGDQDNPQRAVPYNA